MSMYKLLFASDGIMTRHVKLENCETGKVELCFDDSDLRHEYLPCDFVIHTVGPIVSGRLNNEHCRLLESCYKSCLEIATRNKISSIAFCCISTGVFGFPHNEAAEIAVGTAREFLKNHEIKIIFNVFSEEDYEIYKRLLGGN